MREERRFLGRVLLGFSSPVFLCVAEAPGGRAKDENAEKVGKRRSFAWIESGLAVDCGLAFMFY